MDSSINLRSTERMPREAELDSVDEQRRLGREFSTTVTQNSEKETTASWSSSESGIDCKYNIWLSLVQNKSCEL